VFNLFESAISLTSIMVAHMVLVPLGRYFHHFVVFLAMNTLSFFRFVIYLGISIIFISNIVPEQKRKRPFSDV
jgi:hypothetical protein